MRRRHLDVTACTTFDHLDARAEGDGWSEAAVAVLDVASPAGAERVTLGLELDPSDVDRLPHHADYVPLTPAQARTLAAELESVAAAAEQGSAVTSRRG
jgi:hypothetical protein